jgi:hypothetical protein
MSETIAEALTGTPFATIQRVAHAPTAGLQEGFLPGKRRSLEERRMQ